jgi:hypothetical protein
MNVSWPLKGLFWTKVVQTHGVRWWYLCQTDMDVSGTIYTRAVWKVRGLALLLRVGASWRCGDGFRSTSFGKWCTSYNAPPTSRKRAADRWSLRNFLSRSSLFLVGKAQKSHGARSELNSVFSLEKVDRWNLISTSAIQYYYYYYYYLLGPTQPAIQWVPGALSLEVKRPGREADHSPPSSAKVKNAWSYTSTPPIRLHGVVLS